MAEPNISHLIPSSAAALRMIQREAAQEIAMQVESEQDLNQYFELNAFNPMQRARNFKELDELKSKLQTTKEKELEEPEEIKIQKTETVDETAHRFQRNNFELNAKTLLILRDHITADDTAEDILNKVTSVYADPALADEALDFLIATGSPGTMAALKEAKERLNGTFERQIKAGRNMGVQARLFSETGLGSPTSLRDMYRDITGNPRDPLILFNELTERYRYEKLHSVIHFLLHSLGSDLKAKGPSIPHAELKRLIDETRSLQGILGVFRFFQSRMKLMERQFSSYGLVFPQNIDFEILARLFIKILSERFINPDKLHQTARPLGIEEEIAAQIVIYSQMRDAIRQVAPKYFRDARHREEQLKAYLDLIDKLEDDMEEEEKEKQQKEKKEKKEKK
ncbi:MAG TPA: type III secretion system gatekeeper subunit SctW [Chlamydiales bacterium]|nr:type III secretion system gatekeeper subunit SctW [Chlamydiales bacterium]